jgi:NADH dehydrogenase
MHVSDMAEIISNIIDRNICSEIIECVGPEVMTFKEIIEKLSILIGRKKILIPFPLPIAKLIAFFLERLPKPLLTRDQLKLLKYNSVLSGEIKSNLDIEIETKLKFTDEVKKYSYMWKDGGEYSK